MKSSITKYYLLKSLSAYFITSTLSLLSLTAVAGGHGISGGGDTECEARIHEIQNELARWLNVKKDGPRPLNLPTEIK